MFRKVRLIAIVLAAFLPICLLLMFTGNAEIIWHGFGVDSLGQIYVGTANTIDVFLDGIQIRSIPLPAFRSYYFTVDNDELLIAATRDIYTLDLYGVELTHTLDPSARTYSLLQHKRTAQSSNGTIYRAHNLLLRCTISKEDGAVVYKMPMFDFAVKLLLYTAMVAIIYLGTSNELKKDISIYLAKIGHRNR